MEEFIIPYVIKVGGEKCRNCGQGDLNCWTEYKKDNTEQFIGQFIGYICQHCKAKHRFEDSN